MTALALEPQGTFAPQSPRHPAPFRPLVGGAASALYFWASKRAPTIAGEIKTLQALADAADPDGCNTWPTARQVAEASGQCIRTVKRHFKTLRARGVIRVATDPHPPAYLAHMRRTPGNPATRWEIMMPASAFADGTGNKLEQINRYRAERWGKPPITPESRPDLAPRPRRERAASSDVDRRRKWVRAAEVEAAALALEVPPPPDEDAPPLEPVDHLEAAPLEVPAARVVVDPAEAPPLTDEDAPPLEDAPAEVVVPAPRGDTVARLGVTDRHHGGDTVTLNPLTGPPLIDLREPAPLAVAENVSGLKPDQIGANPVPAVGEQAQVVRGRARAARAGGQGSKRERGQATPRRPRGRRKVVLWDVSAEAVEIYTACIPAQVKAYIPDHAMGRILGAITAELERQAAALGCPAGEAVAAQIGERAEGWRYAMPNAEDPVAVVIGAIVRGSSLAPATRPWCGRCEGPTPGRRFRSRANGNLMRCPDCHPLDAPPDHDHARGRTTP